MEKPGPAQNVETAVLMRLRTPVKDLLVRPARVLPDRLFTQILFRWKAGYWPNLTTPETFYEKLSYLKLNDRTPLRELVADRIRVRSYVREHAPQCSYAEQLWIGDELTAAVWRALP